MSAEETGLVGLVFVSHSSKIADGLVDLAGQMAPSVALVAAGGTDDGGVGTSFEKVSSGILAADSGSGAVVLCDLGSAILTADTAMEFLDDVVRDRVRVVDAPLVEGGVAAAVAAAAGGDVDAVADAARSAYQPLPVLNASAAQDGDRSVETEERAARTIVLRNKDGLHARPAAELVKLASKFGSRITVNGTDAKSMLAVMALGLKMGATVEIASVGADADAAVTALSELVRSGFGEA